MSILMAQIDAFVTESPFSGNPAAVVCLEDWPEDSWLQGVALSNNLSETAYLVETPNGYHLRWFTPEVEVDLCGHATLAAAHLVFEVLQKDWRQVVFESKSGPLTVRRDGESLVMDFPIARPRPCDFPADLRDGLGGAPREVLEGLFYYLVSYASEDEITALNPDMALLTRLAGRGVIAAAAGRTADIVYRMFAPALGIDEDPFTGSALTVLVPYWAERLGKTRLQARQCSSRGGEAVCRLDGDRVSITGKAKTFFVGTLSEGPFNIARASRPST